MLKCVRRISDDGGEAMSQTIEAIYEHGVFKPLESINLREGERVQITVDANNDSAKDPAADLPNIAVDLGVADLAVNVDHYLYGLPKQQE